MNRTLSLRALAVGIPCLLITVSADGQGLLDKITEKLSQVAESATTEETNAAGPVTLGLSGTDADDEGVEVQSVKPNGAAARAGMRAGDTIRTIDGTTIRNSDGLAAALKKIRPGQSVEVELDRNGSAKTIEVRFADAKSADDRSDPFDAEPAPTRPARHDELPPPAIPEDAPLTRPDSPLTGREAAPPTGRATLGLSVSDVTEDAVARYRLPVRRGALIEGIQPGSAADRAGLPLAGVVASFDGREIHSSDELIQAVRQTQAGKTVQIGYYQGERLYHKQVQLGSAAPLGAGPAVPPQEMRRRASPPPIGPLLGDDNRRPVLGRIGRVIDQFVQPAAGEQDLAPPVVEREDGDQVRALQEQVGSLQREVERLQRRLEVLERRLQ